MKNKRNHIIFYILFLSANVFGQNKHNIYLDDTIFLKKRCSETNFYFDLKDSLSDGFWLLYDVKKKDSTSKYKSVLLKGYYKNFLKEGIFEINYYSYSGKKKIKKLNYQHIISYFNDKKSGLEEEFRIFSGTQLLISHGEFYNGKKNGLFLYFANNGKISDIYKYCNDSLKEWSEYNCVSSEVKKYKEILVISSNEFKYTLYFYESKIFKLEMFIKDGILENYYVYDNIGNIIDSGLIGLNILYLNPLKTPNCLTSIKENNFINSTVFKEYLEEELKKSYKVLH